MTSQNEINRDMAYRQARRLARDTHLDQTVWQFANKNGRFMVLATQDTPFPGRWKRIETIRWKCEV